MATSSSTATHVVSQPKAPKVVQYDPVKIKQMLTDAQNSETGETPVQLAFKQWADNRAKIGNMAVTDGYYGHGAGGRGDWITDTSDGTAQIQNLDNPGFGAFKLHVLGGVTFFTSKDGQTGLINYTDMDTTTAEGLYPVADTSKPIIKYILVDNGKVYERRSTVSLTDGFKELSDQGTRDAEVPKDIDFELSYDKAAQAELKKLMVPYELH